MSVFTREPHYITGYTGYCPQLKYRIGETYGNLTHKLLVDPSVSHSRKLVIANANFKKENDDQILPYIDTSQRLDNDIVYRDAMIPGYKGFCPRIQHQLGKRYAVSASEALVEYQKAVLRKRMEYEELKERLALQEYKDHQEKSRENFHRIHSPSELMYPLSSVRPEIDDSLTKDPYYDRIPATPKNFHTKQSFNWTQLQSASNQNPTGNKGCTGQRLLFEYPEFGQTSKIETQATLTDFTNNYNFRKTAEWAPIPFYHSSLQADKAGVEIYPRTTGLLPSYQGHVPGLNYSYGKTFGTESKNAKRNLRTGICIH